MSGPTADCPPCAPPSSAAGFRARSWRLIGRCCRWALGAVFLIAAVGKITDLHGFHTYLTDQAGLASPLAFGVAVVLPWLELVCGLCLVSGTAAREAAVLSAILLAVFLVHGLLHPVESDCGCVVWPARWSLPPGRSWMLGRNLALLACALRTCV